MFTFQVSVTFKYYYLLYSHNYKHIGNFIYSIIREYKNNDHCCLTIITISNIITVAVIFDTTPTFSPKRQENGYVLLASPKKVYFTDNNFEK